MNYQSFVSWLSTKTPQSRELIYEAARRYQECGGEAIEGLMKANLEPRVKKSEGKKVPE